VAMLMFCALRDRSCDQKCHSENRDCFTAFCESHVLLRIVKFDGAVKLCLDSCVQKLSGSELDRPGTTLT
jgi:hypothetical protein